MEQHRFLNSRIPNMTVFSLKIPCDTKSSRTHLPRSGTMKGKTMAKASHTWPWKSMCWPADRHTHTVHVEVYVRERLDQLPTRARSMGGCTCKKNHQRCVQRAYRQYTCPPCGRQCVGPLSIIKLTISRWPPTLSGHTRHTIHYPNSLPPFL